jgi:hypothetical protein
VLALGILMHLGIDFSLLVGFFSFAIIVSYIAFIPPETASQRIIALRHWLTERRMGGGSPKLALDPHSRFRAGVGNPAASTKLRAGRAERLSHRT